MTVIVSAESGGTGHNMAMYIGESIAEEEFGSENGVFHSAGVDACISDDDQEPISYTMLAVASKLPPAEAADLLEKVGRHEERHSRLEQKLHERGRVHPEKVFGSHRQNCVSTGLPHSARSLLATASSRSLLASNMKSAKLPEKLQASSMTSHNPRTTLAADERDTKLPLASKPLARGSLAAVGVDSEKQDLWQPSSAADVALDAGFFKAEDSDSVASVATDAPPKSFEATSNTLIDRLSVECGAPCVRSERRELPDMHSMELLRNCIPSSWPIAAGLVLLVALAFGLGRSGAPVGESSEQHFDRFSRPGHTSDEGTRDRAPIRQPREVRAQEGYARHAAPPDLPEDWSGPDDSWSDEFASWGRPAPIATWGSSRSMSALMRSIERSTAAATQAGEAATLAAHAAATAANAASRAAEAAVRAMARPKHVTAMGR